MKRTKLSRIELAKIQMKEAEVELIRIRIKELKRDLRKKPERGIWAPDSQWLKANIKLTEAELVLAENDLFRAKL